MSKFFKKVLQIYFIFGQFFSLYEKPAGVLNSGRAFYGCSVFQFLYLYALYKNVTICALVQVLPEPNSVALTPLVTPFFTAQRTAL